MTVLVALVQVEAQVSVLEKVQELVMEMVQAVMMGKVVFMVTLVDLALELVAKEANQVLAILVSSRQTLLLRTKDIFKVEKTKREML